METQAVDFTVPRILIFQSSRSGWMVRVDEPGTDFKPLSNLTASEVFFLKCFAWPTDVSDDFKKALFSIEVVWPSLAPPPAPVAKLALGLATDGKVNAQVQVATDAAPLKSGDKYIDLLLLICKKHNFIKDSSYVISLDGCDIERQFENKWVVWPRKDVYEEGVLLAQVVFSSPKEVVDHVIKFSMY